MCLKGKQLTRRGAAAAPTLQHAERLVRDAGSSSSPSRSWRFWRSASSRRRSGANAPTRPRKFGARRARRPPSASCSSTTNGSGSNPAAADVRACLAALEWEGEARDAIGLSGSPSKSPPNLETLEYLRERAEELDADDMQEGLVDEVNRRVELVEAWTRKVEDAIKGVSGEGPTTKAKSSERAAGGEGSGGEASHARTMRAFVEGKSLRDRPAGGGAGGDAAGARDVGQGGEKSSRSSETRTQPEEPPPPPRLPPKPPQTPRTNAPQPSPPQRRRKRARDKKKGKKKGKGSGAAAAAAAAATTTTEPVEDAESALAPPPRRATMRRVVDRLAALPPRRTSGLPCRIVEIQATGDSLPLKSEEGIELAAAVAAASSWSEQLRSFWFVRGRARAPPSPSTTPSPRPRSSSRPFARRSRISRARANPESEEGQFCLCRQPGGREMLGCDKCGDCIICGACR